MIPQVNPSITFADSIKICFKKYKDFTGRARRSEFWYFYLLCVVIGFTLGMISLAFLERKYYSSYYYTSYYYEYSSGYYVYLFFMLIIEVILLIPLLAASTRRLHDIGRPGSLNFLFIVPFGIFCLWYFWAIDSQSGANIFGPSVKYNLSQNDQLINNPGVAVILPIYLLFFFLGAIFSNLLFIFELLKYLILKK